MSDVYRHLDEAVERVIRQREQLLADPYATDRAARLALLFESEAQAWSQLFELTSLRLVWRAALVAELVARRNAADWRGRAAAAVEHIRGISADDLAVEFAPAVGEG